MGPATPNNGESRETNVPSYGSHASVEGASGETMNLPFLPEGARVLSHLLIKELKDILPTGKIPRWYRDHHRIVDETTVEAGRFQKYQLDQLTRIFPHWDLVKNPVRVLLSDKPEYNGCYLNSALPVTIVLYKGCFAYGEATSEDRLLCCQSHELIHAQSYTRDPGHKNSKVEELAADLLPLRNIYEAGFNPLAARDGFKKNLAPGLFSLYDSLLSSFDVHPTISTRVSGHEAELARLFLQVGELERESTLYDQHHPLRATIDAMTHESHFQEYIARTVSPNDDFASKIESVQQYLTDCTVLHVELCNQIARFLIGSASPHSSPPLEVIDRLFEEVVRWIQLGYIGEGMQLCKVLSCIESPIADEKRITLQAELDLPSGRPLGKFRPIAKIVDQFIRSETRDESLLLAKQLLDLIDDLPYFDHAYSGIFSKDVEVNEGQGYPCVQRDPVQFVADSWDWPRYVLRGALGADFEFDFDRLKCNSDTVVLPWVNLAQWCKEGSQEEIELLSSAALECGLIDPIIPYPLSYAVWERILLRRGSVAGVAVSIEVMNNGSSVHFDKQVRLVDITDSHRYYSSCENLAINAVVDLARAHVPQKSLFSGPIARLSSVEGALTLLWMKHQRTLISKLLDRNERSPTSRARSRIAQFSGTALTEEILIDSVAEYNSTAEHVFPSSLVKGRGSNDWRAILLANLEYFTYDSTQVQIFIDHVDQILPKGVNNRKEQISALFRALAGIGDAADVISIDPLAGARESSLANPTMMFPWGNSAKDYRLTLFSWVVSLAGAAEPTALRDLLGRCFQFEEWYGVRIPAQKRKGVYFRDLQQLFNCAFPHGNAYHAAVASKDIPGLAQSLRELPKANPNSSSDREAKRDYALLQMAVFCKLHTFLSQKTTLLRAPTISAKDYLTVLHFLPERCFNIGVASLPNQLAKRVRRTDKLSLPELVEVWCLTHDSLVGDPTEYYQELRKLIGCIELLPDNATRTAHYFQLLSRQKRLIIDLDLNLRLTNLWVDSVAQAWGRDDGSTDYTDRAADLVERVKGCFHPIDRMRCLDALAVKVVASEETTRILAEGVSTLSNHEIRSVCQGTPLFDVVLNQVRYSDSLRRVLLEYLCRNEVSLSYCLKLARALEKGVKRRFLEDSLPPLDLKTQAKQLQLLHRTLLSLPEEFKLLPIRELLWPASDNTFLDQLIVFDKASELLFPGNDKDAEYAKSKVKRYIRQLPDYVQPYALSAVVLAAHRRPGSQQSVGHSIVKLINELGGAAEASVAQKAQGHPRTPWEMRKALAQTKTRFSPPSRKEQWKAIRKNVPDEIMRRIKSIPEMIGSGKLYLAFRVEWQEDDSHPIETKVLSVLRPYSVSRAKTGFKYLLGAFRSDDESLNDRTISMIVESAIPSLEIEVSSQRALEMNAGSYSAYGATTVSVYGHTIKITPYEICAAGSGCFVSSYVPGVHLIDLPARRKSERITRRAAYIASLVGNLTSLLGSGPSEQDRHLGNEKFDGENLHLLDLWGLLAPATPTAASLELVRALARSVARGPLFGDRGSIIAEHLLGVAIERPELAPYMGRLQEGVLALGDKVPALQGHELLWVLDLVCRNVSAEHYDTWVSELRTTWKGRLVAKFLSATRNPIGVSRIAATIE